MLKKSDFYSELTQDQSPVWKGSWPETFRNLYSVNGYTSENLAIFLSPDSLKRHLQLLDNNEKLITIRRLFEICEEKAIGIYSNKNDPISLVLLLKLIDLQKIYNEIAMKDDAQENIRPLLFGNSLYDVKNTQILINRFGYNVLSVLAEKINFNPTLIMQIARGLEKDETIDTTGREELVNILKAKYNDVLPLYDWLSSKEETRKHFGVHSKYGENFIKENEEGKEVNIFYDDLPYKAFFTKKDVLNSIAKNMEPVEYADFVFSLIKTNTDDNKRIEFPYHVEERLPQDIALELFRKLTEVNYSLGGSLIDFFLDNIYNKELQDLFKEYPIESFYDTISYRQIYSKIPKYDGRSEYCVVLYQLLRAILSSDIWTGDYRSFIKDNMDDDFNWIDLENNEKIAQNGFGSEEQLFDFYSKHPELTEKCVANFKGKEKIISYFLKATQEEVAEDKDIYQEAIDSSVISVYRELPDTVLEFLFEESKKLGIDKTEAIEYLSEIVLYNVDLDEWKKLCNKMHKRDYNFLGVDLSKINGIFYPMLTTHYGNVKPVIITIIDMSMNKQPIDKLFENLGISSYLAKEHLSLAHEGAHALHYLADPEYVGKEKYDPKELASSMEQYFGNVLENVAYAHGTLPFFKQLVMDNISKVLSSPVFQKAILSWIISNILSSEDAPLQGIYTNKEIMRQAIVLNKQYGTDIQEYVKKKKDRQINKIHDLTIKSQLENKMEILKDNLEREREIKELLKSRKTPDEKMKLKTELQSLEIRRSLISKNFLDIDLDSAAEALAEGYIREYFLSFLETSALSEQDLQDQVRFIMDATFGGTGEYRPLTTEILPISTTPIDRSSGYYPHLNQYPYEEEDEDDYEKEASVIKRLVKISNKIDNKYTSIADKIDKLIF